MILDRSGKVYVLGSTTPLVRSEEESENIPRFEKMEDKVNSVQNEEALVDPDNQQVPMTSLVSLKIRQWARMRMVVATHNSIPKMASAQREESASGITPRNA